MTIGTVPCNRRFEDAPDAANSETLIGVLDAVRTSATEMLVASRRQPTSLRVRVGDVAIELEWVSSESDGHLVHSPVHVPEMTSTPSQPEDSASYLCAQTVGVFYRAAEPGAEPFVQEGDTVQPGQQMAIIEAMKLMIPVKADRHGVVVEVFKEDGSATEYGDRLFGIIPHEET